MQSLTHAVRALATALSLAAVISPAAADIVETQNLGTFDGWTAYRDLYDDGGGWDCSVVIWAGNTDDETYIEVYRSYIALFPDPPIATGGRATLVIDQFTFDLPVNNNGYAATREDDDFISMLALATTPDPGFRVTIAEGGESFDYLFRTRGFRDAYRIAGQACDFDTSLILETRR